MFQRIRFFSWSGDPHGRSAVGFLEGCTGLLLAGSVLGSMGWSCGGWGQR